MKPPRNIVGPVIRARREKGNLTQPDLAAKINLLGWDISRETLAKIEAQFRWVADFEIPILAEAVGLTGPELLQMALAKNKNRAKN